MERHQSLEDDVKVPEGCQVCSRGGEGGAHLDEKLEAFVLLLELFEEADRLVVVAAELSVQLLHPLCVLLGKLRGSKATIRKFNSGTKIDCISTVNAFVYRLNNSLLFALYSGYC